MPFLDELPEFSPRVLEALRQPLEDARVVVSRAAGTASFPARFQLVAAANPCRRGCASLPSCACSPAERARYLARLSRPLLDRIDLHLEIPTLPYAQLTDAVPGEPSAVIRGPPSCLLPLLQANSQSGGVAPTLSTAGFPDSTVHENRDWVRAVTRKYGLRDPGRPDHREPGAQMGTCLLFACAA